MQGLNFKEEMEGVPVVSDLERPRRESSPGKPQLMSPAPKSRLTSEDIIAGLNQRQS